MSCRAGVGRERRRDAAVHERVERERVVGAGREAEARVHARSSSASTSARHARQLGERVVEAPESAVGLLDLVRDHAQLERRHALVEAGREHGVALHRLDRHAARAADARARADRQRERLRQGAPRGGEQRARSGRDRLAVAVAVDRLRCRSPWPSRGIPLPRRAPAMPTCSTVVAPRPRPPRPRSRCRPRAGRCRRRASALPRRRRAPEGWPRSRAARAHSRTPRARRSATASDSRASCQELDAETTNRDTALMRRVATLQVSESTSVQEVQRMFVNNEITERGLLHRLLDRVSNEVTLEERMIVGALDRRRHQGRREPGRPASQSRRPARRRARRGSGPLGRRRRPARRGPRRLAASRSTPCASS